MVLLGVLVDMSLALASGALGARLRRSPRFLGLHPYLTGGVYLAMGAGAALAHPGRTR
jgi:threonine/homoserine/homoserine lactone efflux protein